MTSVNPNYLPKALPLNTVTLGLRLQHANFWWGGGGGGGRGAQSNHNNRTLKTKYSNYVYREGSYCPEMLRQYLSHSPPESPLT